MRSAYEHESWGVLTMNHMEDMKLSRGREEEKGVARTVCWYRKLLHLMYQSSLLSS